jgi:hypothetical protein
VSNPTYPNDPDYWLASSGSTIPVVAAGWRHGQYNLTKLEEVKLEFPEPEFIIEEEPEHA